MELCKMLVGDEIIWEITYTLETLGIVLLYVESWFIACFKCVTRKRW